MIQVKSKGFTQIIIGLIVVGISYFMNRSSKEPKFTFFLFVGGVFLIYGIFKLILWTILREDKPKTRRERVEKKMNAGHVEVFKSNQGPTHTHHSTVIACHTCDTKHYGNANYCQMCGTRLKK